MWVVGWFRDVAFDAAKFCELAGRYLASWGRSVCCAVFLIVQSVLLTGCCT